MPLPEPPSNDENRRHARTAEQRGLKRFSVSARMLRFLLNVWPPYLGAGVRVTEMSPDFRRATVQMRLRPYNRNYFGTHFGGSLYSMVNPFYVLMFSNILGRGYVVWDRQATIRYVSPARGTVRAHFVVRDEDVEAARVATEDGGKHEPVFTIEILNGDGQVVAIVDQTLYLRRTRSAAPSEGSSA